MRPPRGRGFGGRDGGRGGRDGGRGGGRGFGGRGGGRGGGGYGYDQGPPDSVVEAGSFSHPCEGEAVCKLTNEKVPYFNAPIYLENKTQIGKVEEILGAINNVYFTVKMSEGVQASSYTSGDKFFIDPMKLLPMERFLPQPKGAPGAGGRGGVARVAALAAAGVALAAGAAAAAAAVGSAAGAAAGAGLAAAVGVALAGVAAVALAAAGEAVGAGAAGGTEDHLAASAALRAAFSFVLQMRPDLLRSLLNFSGSPPKAGGGVLLGARIVASAGADSPQQRPVFKLTSSGPEMSLDDIRDAFEVCSLIPSPGERSQCYSCWGIDSDRMAAYYDLVLDLERSLEGGMVAHHMADPDEFQSVNTSMAE
ncbi:H/ACA ribonucleoprotein complex subunit 1 [Monoraphidium neglectum]|uniref:H/ACA ribonucleoprotein complex subunit 1 n=1 Tax=Monoraphidium neglectum TaxID=145388 RepID=A0A0D2MJF0_9CHLO|nr:H/ACA ribonucleoprotein complex subunit 1 [Monoraphidium neglectum]KIZ00737.1 H/ACA ribonucleoprotein complex subunit 1 [Monoraphidium neglectum]|eukprot:XP_013899756.1 H/ACA ribonucleoprotein complex subunit 1 [Monoraphidium neglectum]